MNYPKGHEFEYRGLKPSQILVDKLYQRDLNTNRVDQIVREFNGDLFNEPKVSYRDGQFWVFNGQHSIAAWRKLHGGDDKSVLCKVYKGMTWLDECTAFIAQNGISKDPTTNERLRAAYEAKRPDVTGMVKGAELVGFTVNFKLCKCRNQIVAVAALFRAYKTLETDAYIDMLTAIRDAWNGTEESLSSQIINGMTAFYKTFGGNFKREDLVKSISKIRPVDIIREGRVSTKHNGYAREIAKAYNYKRTTRRVDVEAL